MNLLQLVQRPPTPAPWQEGEKIPWNEPAFSQRMLREHLNQQHDAASRRKPKIKKQVRWIQEKILPPTPSRILDLGCGPGFYCAEFATLGHVCQGIDFSPASIDYARRHAPPNCTYTLQDLRSAPFGTGYDLVLFIFGEFNVFTAQDAQAILHKAHAALRPSASLLLEISTLDAVEQLGNQPSTWYSSPGGLFSERPHLCLMESFWEDASQTATERYLVIDAETAEVTRYASSTRGYDEGSILPMLAEAGFGSVEFFPSLTGKTSQEVDEFLVVHAKA